MVAVVLFCEVCSQSPAHFHTRFPDGHELHFCSGEHMNKYCEDDPNDETCAFYISLEAPGAFPNGTEVIKVNSEPGDGHPDGTEGVVIGSIGPQYMEKFGRDMLAYFVEWNGTPMPIGTVDIKVKKKA